MRNLIKKKLLYLGYNISNKGTFYLIEVIEFICSNENSYELLGNLEKNVYMVISGKYNVNVKTLKSDISKATNKINIKKNNYYTPKDVVFLIVDEIVNRKNK